jgi:hypothetical protein
MKLLHLVGLGVVAAGVAISCNVPDAKADPAGPIPGPGGGIDPVGGSVGVGQPGLGGGGPGLSPAAATIFLCPGRGGAASVIGGGGGYCDWNFTPVKLGPNSYGVMHDHCEWGGFNPLVEMWNCWRVWPGQPDHPALPDPDIIPDGMGVPWAIRGPDPTDQWPPPGLAPFQDLLSPQPGEPVGPLPGPPPEPPPP